MDVEAIIFDLGNVLVDYDNAPISRMLARCARRDPFRDPGKVHSFIFDRERGIENSFDRGEIPPEVFFELLKRAMDLDMEYGDFLRIWNPIFVPKPWVDSLLNFLKGKVEIALLSNTNRLHFDYIKERCAWLSLIDHVFVSFEIGSRKPERKIYLRALEALGRPPGAILFLDDLEENIRPAKEMGMKTIVVKKQKEAPALLMEHLPWLPWEEWEQKNP
jgi:putative hydrolase of the HAD superfamily